MRSSAAGPSGLPLAPIQHATRMMSPEWRSSFNPNCLHRPPGRYRTNAGQAVATIHGSSTKASTKWHTMECLRPFRTCGSPTHSPLVLADYKYLKQLASGYRPPALLQDIEHLLEFPAVVRTDIANSRQSACRMLLPRTDTLTRPVQMVGVLAATSAAFLHAALSVA